MISQQGVTVFKDTLTTISSTYTVLVAVANPTTSDGLLELGAALASNHQGDVLAVHVVPSSDSIPHEDERKSAVARRLLLEEAVVARWRDHVPIHTESRLAPTPAEGILAAALESRCSLILMGWQGRVRPASWGSSLGRVLDPVIRNAPCTVAVAKIVGSRVPRRILVPTSGGPNAALAFGFAMDLAHRYKGDVTLLHIAREGQEGLGRRLIARTIGGARPRVPVHERVIVAENVVKGILQVAKEYDLVLLGASSEGLFHQLLFGVIPEQVAKRCTKTVIMVKGAPSPLVTGLRRLWAVWASITPHP